MSCLSYGLPPQPSPPLGESLILHILRWILYQVLHGFVPMTPHSCLENFMDRRAWQAIVHGLQRVEHDWVTNTFRFHLIKLSTNEWFGIYDHTVLPSPILLLNSPCLLPRRIEDRAWNSKRLRFPSQLGRLTGCEVRGKFLHLSEPQYPRL